MIYQVVKTAKEANSLPDNIIPLSFKDKKESLSIEELRNVAGGATPYDDEHDINYSNAPWYARPW